MHKEENSITEYSYTADTGDAQAVVYRLFPGMEVAYISVHIEAFDFGLFEKGDQKNCASIHYCREGRIEQEMDHAFFHLMPGDCAVAIRETPRKVFRLPLRHYQGIRIGIDLDAAHNPLTAYWESCGFSPRDALEHICGGISQTVLRESDAARQFFGDLYAISPDQRLDYLRMKMPELFYRMQWAKADSGCPDRAPVPRAQVEIAKAVAAYITQNLNEKITVKQLTAEFGVSDTYLQNAFRSIYGMPVIRFIRAQKMQSAAQVLIHTTRKVDEIAEAFGYENESKFSAAFKKIMGDPPGLYRKAHTTVKIL